MCMYVCILLLSKARNEKKNPYFERIKFKLSRRKLLHHLKCSKLISHDNYLLADSSANLSFFIFIYFPHSKIT